MKDFNVGLLAILVGIPVSAGAQQPIDERLVSAYDVIIRGGTVLDGSGLDPFVADVAVVGERITRIGDLGDSPAEIEIDARGLFVAPGFINIHSHASVQGLPRAENMLTQGVTTEIMNADGVGWPDIRWQLARFSRDGLAVNLGAYTGFSTAWAEVVPNDDRRLTDEESAGIHEQIVDNLARGAWGVSAGLDYYPSRPPTDEFVRAIGDLSDWRTNFTNHERVTPESGYSQRWGQRETMTIGGAAGMLPVITHMKIGGHEQGTAGVILSEMQTATESGRYAAADVYPYLFGMTGLPNLILPKWAQEGSREQILERFSDLDLRRRITAEADTILYARFGGPTGVFLAETRRELVDVMREQGTESGGEAVVHVLEEGGGQLAILRFGIEADLVEILRHPTASIACDCGATLFAFHPREFGTFPRVLGRYVRDQGVLTWQEAVRKMTALPAATIGMVDRGYVATGMFADLVLFDSATVIDNATFDDPNGVSEGIRHVFVNGRQALRDGKPTGIQGGQTVFRSQSMPSRPMSTGRARSVSVSGQGSRPTEVDEPGSPSAEVELDVRQAPDAPHATGSFRYSDPRSGIEVEATDLGVLQTTAGWASFTGVARVAGRDRALLIIVEEADPAVRGSPTVTIEIDGVQTTRLIVPVESIDLRP